MEELEDTVRALTDHVEAQGGVLLAHTALVSAIVSVMKAKGLLTQNDVNSIYDVALIAAEVSPEITAETSRRARLMLELMSREMGGPIRQDPS